MASASLNPETPGAGSAIADGSYKPHNRSAKLNFWTDPGDGSAPSPLYVGDVEVSLDRPLVPVEVQVHDVRGKEDQYTLDNHSFKFLKHETECSHGFDNNEKIKKEYYPECEELLKAATGGTRAHVFDHRVRLSTGEGRTGPVSRAHVDESEEGAASYLKHYLPKEAEELAKRRWQIINVWRPIKTIKRDPLTVADAKSFTGKDFLGAVVHYPGWQGESLVVLHDERQKWYYKYQMAPDEVVLIKNFDSDTTVPARACPHSAIEDPEDPDVESRHSVEVRAFVFH